VNILSQSPVPPMPSGTRSVVSGRMVKDAPFGPFDWLRMPPLAELQKCPVVKHVQATRVLQSLKGMNSPLNASPHGDALVHSSRPVAPPKGIVKPRPSVAVFIARPGFDCIIIFD
jgi:hypothetical protein